MRPIPYRLRTFGRRDIDIRHGGTTLSVPVEHGRVWARWQPSWKRDLISRFAPNGWFMDVGANVGQTLADYLDARPANSHYLGFEPLAEAAGNLQTIVTGNQIDATIVATGLAAKSGLVALYIHGDADDQATMVADLRPGRDLVERIVPVTIGDDVWKLLGEPWISLIKIDVEGSELDVLRGMSRLLAHCRPKIICEVLGADGGADLTAYRARLAALGQLVRDANYSIHRIDKEGSMLAGLTPMTRFPVMVWEPHNAEQFDYLLTPND